MKKQKLMILAAAKFTVPLIKTAKLMGFHVIVVSIAGNYPGLAIADTACEVDVRDKEKILEIARKEEICGVVTDQADPPVPAVAYVAEKMGLPGIGYECALRISDKLTSRLHCQKKGFPVPVFDQASSIDEAIDKAKKIGFPLVLKPTDAMAARGIARLDDMRGFEPRFRSALAASPKKVVLLEKFFEGKKIGVIGFKSGGQSARLIIVDHEHFDIPNLFIVRQVLTPSRLDINLQDKIWRFHEQLFESYEAPFGFTYSEIRINENTGKFCLIESAIRGPAGFVSSHLVPLACQVDFLPVLIEIATRRLPIGAIDTTVGQTGAAGNVYFYLPAGVICQVEGIEKVKSLTGVHHTELEDLRVGRKIEPLVNLTGRQGPIVYAGKDRRATEETIETIQAVLKVEVETPHGKRPMLWS